ncbi:flagellar brake protein [Thioalkalivibrio sp. ALJ24]|uniref:flagellar brake protein n=1 Tax=Thioalkalivibrio sp. ALJ24 TaxID=545276 RepID=UPI00037D7A56|nr:flagellar brake protein [Thioalkalivibrio sp. ALJ24]
MDDPDYTVDTPLQIAQILRDLDHGLTLVSVRLEEHGPLYTSALIRLDPDARRLYLDQLQPPSLHRRIRPGQSLRVFATLRGVAVRFTTQVLQIVSESPGDLYECPYPAELQYLQRRETFRVHIPLSVRPTLQIQGEMHEEPLEVPVVDLSAEGMCLELPEEALHEVPFGARLDFSNLLLPDVPERVSGALKLANTRPSPRDGHVYAGCSIIEMSARLERALNVALLHYQREERRRKMD